MGDAVEGVEARVEAVGRVLEDDLDVLAQRRAVEVARGLSADRLPSNRISPSLASISRQTSREIVLLPEPDSPTRPRLSPARIAKETSFTATTPRS